MTGDLLELLYRHDELADLDPAARRLAIRHLVADEVDPDRIARAVAVLADAVDGLGPLAAIMADEEVTDVLVNGPGEIWAERGGRLERVAARFTDRDHLREWLQRLIGEAGERIDASCPIADARLASGARIHGVLPPVAPDGPLVSIRRWPAAPLTLDELVARGTLDGSRAEWMVRCVRSRRTLVISGATGTGKTTLLNALLALVPETERVVTVEELPELAPGGGHTAALVTRAANVEGKGEIELHDLVRAALRMRPDRIVVGEVRGPEALPAVWALSTGHEGSMMTVHARSASDALERLVTLAMLGAGSPGVTALERQVRAAVDVVVHLERSSEGRVVSEVLDLRA